MIIIIGIILLLVISYLLGYDNGFKAALDDLDIKEVIKIYKKELDRKFIIKGDKNALH